MIIATLVFLTVGVLVYRHLKRQSLYNCLEKSLRDLKEDAHEEVKAVDLGAPSQEASINKEYMDHQGNFLKTSYVATYLLSTNSEDKDANETDTEALVYRAWSPDTQKDWYGAGNDNGSDEAKEEAYATHQGPHPSQTSYGMGPEWLFSEEDLAKADEAVKNLLVGNNPVKNLRKKHAQKKAKTKPSKALKETLSKKKVKNILKNARKLAKTKSEDELFEIIGKTTNKKPSVADQFVKKGLSNLKKAAKKAKKKAKKA